MKLTERKRPPLQAAYTVSQLAKLTGIDRFVLRRLLKRNGVEMLRSGKTCIVTVVALQEAVPDLWVSVLLVRSLEA